jgi:hypothetical protein
MTDTFGGEANYSWKRQVYIDLSDTASDLRVVRAAKKALGISGLPCDREIWGEMLVLRLRGECVIMFIQPEV